MSESGKWLPYLLSFPASACVRFVGRTSRFHCTGPNYRTMLLENKGPYIFCLWHSRVLLPIYHFGGTGLSVLVSKSKDGEYITQVINRHRIHAARGSTSRHGAEGMLGLLHRLKQGKSVAVTVDGPRGPCEKVQPGVIQLARLSGIPITPVCFHSTRHKRLNSWDRFIVPLPFGTIHMVSGDAIDVPRDLDKEGLEEKRRQVEEAMLKVMAIAEDLIER